MQNHTFTLPDHIVDRINKYGWKEGTKGCYLEFKIEIKQPEKVEPEYIHNLPEGEDPINTVDSYSMSPETIKLLPDMIFKSLTVENVPKKSGRPRIYPKKDPDAPKKKSGRPRVLSAEDVKKNKKEYAKKYQKKRYNKDETYRSERIHRALKYYYNKHPQEIKPCVHDDK